MEPRRGLIVDEKIQKATNDRTLTRKSRQRSVVCQKSRSKNKATDLRQGAKTKNKGAQTEGAEAREQARGTDKCAADKRAKKREGAQISATEEQKLGGGETA